LFKDIGIKMIHINLKIDSYEKVIENKNIISEAFKFPLNGIKYQKQLRIEDLLYSLL
jgi:hypothetical protein